MRKVSLKRAVSFLTAVILTCFVLDKILIVTKFSSEYKTDELKRRLSAESSLKERRKKFDSKASDLRSKIDVLSMKHVQMYGKVHKHIKRNYSLRSRPEGSRGSKLWFMKNGSEAPKTCENDCQTGYLYPGPNSNDRIVDQLMFLPPIKEISGEAPKFKKILLWGGLGGWTSATRDGQHPFISENCPVNTCLVTGEISQRPSAHLILFKAMTPPRDSSVDPNQIWLLYQLESPKHTTFKSSPNSINWTATYRSDSTVVAPYEKWVYYDDNVKIKQQDRNFAQGKTKMAAIFVSNCATTNFRLEYVKELKKHISVDIYGSCGDKKCPRSDSKKCLQMLDEDYKFYLAFENSNCRDYITEKFFVNGLSPNVIPIVRGAHPDDYRRAAPENSYIHVDDFESPKHLADYLHILDQDDNLYNQYFQWKGTGEFINTKFFCRLCSMLHDPNLGTSVHFSYDDTMAWWKKEGTCVKGVWKDQEVI